MKTEAFQTPAESTEAKIQEGRLEKARKEAEYYRTFLKSLREKVLVPMANLFTQKFEALKDMTDRDMASFRELTEDIIEEAKNEAREKTNISPDGKFVNLEILGKMTPKEFIEYLDKLESELVK